MNIDDRVKEDGLEIFSGYAAFLNDIKARVRSAQLRAALAVNQEQILLYWQIGTDISRKMQEHGWGAKVVDRLSADLRREFPNMRGFSPRNLRYMRSFAEAWQRSQFCSSLLQKSTGFITACCWINSRILRSGSGMPGRR